MSSFTPAKLLQLRASLSAHPDKEVLRDYFKSKNSSNLISHAVLVTLHRTWSAYPPYRLTSLGITTYTRAHVNDGYPVPSGPHAETLLRSTWCMHLVLRSTAHLDSTAFPPGLPPFHFGKTVYVTQAEALDMLQTIWHQPINEQDPNAGFRPIIYLSYGDNDSVSRMRRPAFDFCPSNVDTTVATLDAQVIPQQAKMTRHAGATLGYLLTTFHISCVYDKANAGNYALYTMMVAILSALRQEIYGCVKENMSGKPGRTGMSKDKGIMEVLQGMMDGPTPAPPWGIEVYCWKCGSEGQHGFEGCGLDMGIWGCERCERSVQGWRRENAKSHVGGLCAFR